MNTQLMTASEPAIFKALPCDDPDSDYEYYRHPGWQAADVHYGKDL